MKRTLELCFAGLVIGVLAPGCASGEDANAGQVDGSTDDGEGGVDGSTEAGEGSVEAEAGPADVSVEPAPEAAMEAAPDIVAEPEAAVPQTCTELPGGVCRANDCAVPTSKNEVHWTKFDKDCTSTPGQVCCALTDCVGPNVLCSGGCITNHPNELPQYNCGAWKCCSN